MSDKEQVVWGFSCGCVTGWMHQNGDFECANCGEWASESSTGEWLISKAVPAVTKEGNDSNFKIVDMNSTGAALDRVARNLQTRRNEIVGMALIYANGTHSNWFALDTEEQAQWAKDRLDEMKENIDAKFQNQSVIRQA